MLKCPHCKAEIVLKTLPHPGFFKDYRICPGCGGKFTPDRETKYRQAVCIIVALLSLLFTGFMYHDGTDWLVPAVISYVALAGLIFWGNKKIYLVPYRTKQQPTD